jgi:hypothetical protein
MGCGASVVKDNKVLNDEAGQSIHSMKSDKPSNQPTLQVYTTFLLSYKGFFMLAITLRKY